jgi:hypothetical protein
MSAGDYVLIPARRIEWTDKNQPTGLPYTFPKPARATNERADLAIMLAMR